MKTGNRKNGELKQAVEMAAYARSELEREIFLLRALHDTSRELSGFEDTREIMETFLLMLMDTFCLTHGFVLLIDTEALDGQIVTRGFEDGAVSMLHENVPKIVSEYFSDITPEGGSSGKRVQLISREGSAPYALCPAHTEVLIKWTIEKKYAGIVGLGEKGSPEEYGDTEIEILLSFTNHLILSLESTMSIAVIRELNVNVNQKNIELEKALKLGERAQQELNKRLFHLVILYDTSRELGGTKETEKVVDSFLLMAMGTFSAAQGYILMLNRNEKSAVLSLRGIEKEKTVTLSEDDIEKTTEKLFEAAEQRKMAPMGVQKATDKEILDKVPISMEAQLGLIFLMDENSVGVMALGGKMTPGDYLQEDQELLLGLANNFVVFLENSRSFEIIRKLNVDLEKRNIELRKTIDDLRASKHTIEVLERTKARVKSAIQREMERTGRVSVMDFLSIMVIGLILGLIFNFANPSGISLVPLSWLHESVPLIDIDGAKIKYDSKEALFVDARPVVFYKLGHIQGAINMPLTLLDFMYMMKFSNIDPQKEIIVYGKSLSRLYDKEVALKLTSRGHTNVKVLAVTLSQWEKKGYPLGQ